MVYQFFKTGYQKLKHALAKTGSIFGKKLKNLFSRAISDETMDQLEQILYEADLGVKTSQELTEKIRGILSKNPKATPEMLIDEIRKELIHSLSMQTADIIEVTKDESPLVILVVGVNGNGKTTTVAKLAKKFQEGGKKVLLAAADTFRAAAIQQLELWANQLQIEIVKGIPNSDPSAVVFDAITAGKSREVDVVIIDTAGRLHTKTNLMQELEKIRRTCKKVNPHSPHETFLVLDATTGQNAIDQAKIFHKFTPITGLILTKLDGTAKGGIVLGIQQQLGIPVKFIGVGESIDDLEPFQAESFVNALFE